jgi:hypothetical protein
MRVVVVRVVVPSARRENVRKPDIVGGLVGWVAWWFVDRLIEVGRSFDVKKVDAVEGKRIDGNRWQQ